MIPGISHQKTIADNSGKKPSPVPKSSKALSLEQEIKLNEQVGRLAGYGWQHLGNSGSEKNL
jgi:hypothetical protein